MIHEPHTGFPIQISVPVRWGDMDAFGHVNNTVFFRYFECARIAYFEEIALPERPAGLGGPILASTKCDFLLPLDYPDTVRVDAGIETIGRSSFTMLYQVFSEKHQALVGRGSGVVVWYDYSSRRSQPLPEPLRERIHRLEGLGQADSS